MILTERNEIKEKRKYFLHNAEKVTTIKKGDRRVVSSTRFCVICHRPLSTLVKSTGKTISTVDHFSCVVNDFIRVNMCKDIRSCYNNCEKDESGEA